MQFGRTPRGGRRTRCGSRWGGGCRRGHRAGNGRLSRACRHRLGIGRPEGGAAAQALRLLPVTPRRCQLRAVCRSPQGCAGRRGGRGRRRGGRGGGCGAVA
eukprot:331586-Chlamydomonas_euryale.AAC.7